MTSSGRRVKRRNLDECDGNPVRCNQTRKSRNGRKASKRKSSTSKSLRPQRAAARNALNLFSRITGTSTEGEDEDGSENLSESESTLQDSVVESDESDRSLQNERTKHLKGKEVPLDESEDVIEPYELPESHIDGGTRKRLVLKLPIRDSNKLVLSRSSFHKSDHQAVFSSSKANQEAIEENGNHKRSPDPGYCSEDADCSIVERKGRRIQKVVDHLDLSESSNNGQIRWGGAKARTSKRLRFGEAMSSDAYARYHVSLLGQDQKGNNIDSYVKSQSPNPEMQNYGDNMEGLPLTNGTNIVGITSEGFRGESSKHALVVAQNNATSSLQYENGTCQHPEQNERVTPISTKLRLRSRRISMDPENPKQELKFSVENWDNGMHESLSDEEQDRVAPENDGTSKTQADHGDEAQELDTQMDTNSLSITPDSQELQSNANRMYTAVYKRLKSNRNRANLEVDNGVMGESTSHVINQGLTGGLESQEGSIDGTCRTSSVGLKVSKRDSGVVPDSPKTGQGRESGRTHGRSTDKYQLPSEKWGSSSRMTFGLRSTRIRRSSNFDRDRSPIDRRKSHQSARKGLWLLLSMHEEGSRYIPQQGDEVVYLRQVSFKT